MTIHVLHALVPQCVLSVLSYLECKIAEVFQDFAHRPHWGGLTANPLPDSPTAKRVFCLATLVKKLATP